MSRAPRPSLIDLDSISWEDLRLFVLASRYPSFRRAAPVLGVSAPTLVRKVENLENTLSVQLFHRLPEGVALTPVGARVAAAVAQMRAPLQALKVVLEEERMGRPLVSLSVSQGLGINWIIPNLRRFKRAHREIVFDLKISNDPADILRWGTQLSIQFLPPSNPDLISFKLGRMHFSFFASDMYLKGHGTPRELADLHRHQFIVQIDTHLPTRQIELQMMGREPSTLAMRVNGSLANIAAIEAGLGIGVLPTYSIAFGNRVKPIDVGTRTSTDVWLAFHPEVREIASVRTVIDWVRSLFDSRRYPWFADEYRAPETMARFTNFD